MIAKAKVFEKDGNRFLVPGCWYVEGRDEETGDALSAMSNALMLSVVCGANYDEGWMEFSADDEGTADLTHVPHRIVGRQFAHGGIDILLISGPLFDEAINSHAEVSA